MWKVGIHNCYWMGTGFDTQEQALYASARAGVDCYEVPAVLMARLSHKERRQIKEVAEELGLTLTANGGFTLENDIASAAKQVRDQGIADAKAIIESLADMGIKSWSGINYAAWKRVPEPGSIFSETDKKEVWNLSLDSLKEIIKTAEENEVTLCLEVVNRYEQFLLNTAAEGVEMAEEVGSDYCKVLLDTYHMNIEEENIGDAVRYAVSRGRLGELHVSEPNRKVPGTGNTHMDWPDFFKVLNELHYEGLITMEPFLLDGYAISSKICIWRDLSEKAEGEDFVEKVRTGAGFIRKWYKATA